MLSYLQGLSKSVNFEGGLLVYSMWSGYQQQVEMSRFLKACEEMGLKIISLHTSGHADAEAVQQLIDAVKPKEIIPMHTENAAWLKNGLVK